MYATLYDPDLTTHVFLPYEPTLLRSIFSGAVQLIVQVRSMHVF
jgi:hypothetical protein